MRYEIYLSIYLPIYLYIYININININIERDLWPTKMGFRPVNFKIWASEYAQHVMVGALQQLDSKKDQLFPIGTWWHIWSPSNMWMDLFTHYEECLKQPMSDWISTPIIILAFLKEPHGLQASDPKSAGAVCSGASYKEPIKTKPWLASGWPCIHVFSHERCWSQIFHLRRSSNSWIYLTMEYSE